MTIKQNKSRFHKVLFLKDTPFKHKVEKSKAAYARRPKHSKRALDTELQLV